ncbi:MAG TPA: ABC transporter permease [Spirochaetota bacterium]|jgi:ABC-2 type transport system permease protein|nr:ABC transporter permease [Spirochaetota bacterium]
MKLSLNNIKIMIRKEFTLVIRDPKLRAIIIVPPILMTLVFGYAVNTDVNDVLFSVYDRDRTAQSRIFIQQFVASPYFALHSYIDSPKQGMTLIEKGDTDFYLEIENGFSKALKTGKPVALQVILDGTDSSRASVIQSYINSITLSYIQEQFISIIKMKILLQSQIGLQQSFIELIPRYWFNQDLKSVNFYLPGVIAMLIALITIMLTSMSIVKERETGTMEQIKVSPLKPQEYMIGKLVPFAIIAFIDIIMVTAIAIFWFGIPFRGSFVFLLLSGIIYIVSTLAIGLFISSVSSTQQQAMLSSLMFFFPSILLSGVIFPIYSMPKVIQLVTYLNPMRYFAEIVRGIFLKGSGLYYLWHNIIILLVMSIVILRISIWQFGKR